MNFCGLLEHITIIVFIYAYKLYVAYTDSELNWRTHLKFRDEAKLSPEAKNLICKLLCVVEKRLGTKGAHEIKVMCGLTLLLVVTEREINVSFWRLQAHPWFKGIEWEKLYQMEAACSGS
ncbi:putative non-specific serine/threonine protein kinase [Helianthus anomalus]